MEFFENVYEILTTQNPYEKIEKFYSFYKRYQNGECSFKHSSKVVFIQEPSFKDYCKIVPAKEVPKRKNVNTKQGKINLLHAIIHIEYNAIDLALDASYRFRNLPKKFYDDWLEVAEDEIRHFELIDKLLQSLGAKYSDLPVHNALFEASQKTQNLLERMAVVPRFYEANGLDSTPAILKRLAYMQDDTFIVELKKVLGIILEEEVSHVKKGDFWFKFACDREGKAYSIYFDIIQKFFPRRNLNPKELNVNARKEAGFTCNELNILTKEKIC